MDDRELHELLNKWKAPGAPSGLEEKLFARPERDSWWRWLLRGSIQVPVPVGAIVVAALIASIYGAIASSARRVPVSMPQQVSLADFRPVPQLEVRIIRSAYESQ